VTDTSAPADAAAAAPAAPLFVQYVFFKADAAWRRLPADERECGRREFADVVRAAAGVRTYAYSTIGLKATDDFMLWWKGPSLPQLQETLAALLQTGFGRYCQVSHLLWGMVRPSVYTKRRTTQEQAIDLEDRLRYFIVYPFTKTVEWYLLTREVRQGYMNEHMRVGHEFEDVRQVLVYTTGLDDQEFVVAYETDDIERHHQLVVALRATNSRAFTERDTPIFTAIHRPLDEALALVG
jgi:chlorite dismutase